MLDKLKPERVFYYFREISSIPRGSGNTKQISDYCVSFAKMHNLSYIQDSYNNIIIKKSATKGRESDAGVILQGHLDMVTEKKQDSKHDFNKDGLKLMVEGDYIYAEDTTLGADDGIAIAYALAILEDENISHPSLEAIFTVDEEIGLLGAKSIDLSTVTGKYLLNIDSEEESTLLVGCAGGLTAKCTIPVFFQEIDKTNDLEKLEITVCGLKGGHSGTEIKKERGNADILLGRVLFELTDKISDIGLIDIYGGTKDNAIPRSATAKLIVPKNLLSEIKEIINKLGETINNELSIIENEVIFKVNNYEMNNKEKVLDYKSFTKVIFFLMETPNGVINMDKFIDGLVETSLNLGILELNDGYLLAKFSVRSSVKSRKMALSCKLGMLVELLGGEYEAEGEYPEWTYRKQSNLRDLMSKLYKEIFNREPVLETIHAGVECGYFIEKIGDIDAVSFGPDIYDIHTTEEKMSISSVKRVYEYILLILEYIR